MKYLEALVLSLQPYGVYQSAQNISTNVFLFITPFVLIIAVAVRTLETQLDTMSGLGKWERAFRDFICFGILIGSYFFMMTLVNMFMNEVLLVIDDFGNYRNLSRKLELLLDKGLGVKASDAEWLKNFTRKDIGPMDTPMVFLHWVSNLFVVSVYVFLQVAHAITYSFALVMGLIVIPMAIATKFNYLKGWGIVLGTALLWPFVEGIFMGFAGDIFVKSIQKIIDSQSVNLFGSRSDKLNLRAFFSTINLILGMIMITAPIVTGAVLAGTNAMFPMVAPFGTAAFGLSKAVFSAGASMMPGGKAFGMGHSALGAVGAAGAGALGGMLGLKTPGGGEAGPGASYSGGPKSRSGGRSGGSPGGRGGDGSSAGTSGSTASHVSAGDADGGDGPTSRSDESKALDQEARKRKRRKARVGYFAHKHRKKTTE